MAGTELKLTLDPRLELKLRLGLLGSCSLFFGKSWWELRSLISSLFICILFIPDLKKFAGIACVNNIAEM